MAQDQMNTSAKWKKTKVNVDFKQALQVSNQSAVPSAQSEYRSHPNKRTEYVAFYKRRY